jgi:hypothetical protein
VEKLGRPPYCETSDKTIRSSSSSFHSRREEAAFIRDFITRLEHEEKDNKAGAKH